MKKAIYVLLMVTVLFVNSVTASATKGNYIISEIEYLEDGNYYIDTLEVESENNVVPIPNNYDLSSMFVATSSSLFLTSSATKTRTYYGGTNNKLWSVSVKGVFSYNGMSSTCTSSSVSAATYDSYWKVSDKKASKSENKAIASAKGTIYSSTTPSIALGSAIETVTLTCDRNGRYK